MMPAATTTTGTPVSLAAFASSVQAWVGLIGTAAPALSAWRTDGRCEEAGASDMANSATASSRQLASASRMRDPDTVVAGQGTVVTDSVMHLLLEAQQAGAGMRKSCDTRL